MGTSKPLEFLGSSRDDLRKFPTEVRRAIGAELLRVQLVYEIRVRLDGAWRVIYVAKFDEAIYVLHAFQKKTQQTPKEDIDLAAKRYRIIGG